MKYGFALIAAIGLFALQFATKLSHTDQGLAITLVGLGLGFWATLDKLDKLKKQ